MGKFIALFLLASIHFSTITGQTSNPIAEKIKYSGISVELIDAFTIPSSSNSDPKARINMLREIPDDSGRKAVIDLRGTLWVETDEIWLPFLEIKDFSPDFIDDPGKGTGFGAFDFHPEYEENGLFYTAHSESTNSSTADFVPQYFTEIALQWVITEWKIDDPSQNIFSGNQRELFRADFPKIIHGIQDIQFNPTSITTDEDYGLLYICIGEGGSSLDFLSENLRNKNSYLGTIFRIDPLGNNSKNGNYGIPPINPYADDEQSVGEVFAFGFRNPHRISWDTGGEHKMIIGDIGEKNIEELNIGLAGHDYGWDEREGRFEYIRELGRDFVYNLPEDDSIYHYTYPVAQYDHDDGVAIVAGYVYRGTKVPELYGHYIFGDIASGRIFHVPVDDLILGQLAEIKELNILNELGNHTTLKQLAQTDRPDLRFGIDQKGEIYFLTKADGKIRKIKPTVTSLSNTEEPENFNVFPNPSNGVFMVKISEDLIGAPYEVLDVNGKLISQGSLIKIISEINLTSMPTGMYFLHFHSSNENFVHELIVNK